MNKYVINNKTKISKALLRFDKLGGNCLYVVKKNNYLVGSLTDGDWRRASLKGLSKNNSVETICNKSPIKINNLISHSNIKIKKLFKDRKLISLPVVNKKNILLKIIFKDQLNNFKNSLKIIKNYSVPVVIMAGGKGTRLSPFTDVLPKPLIPIKGKTIISRITENFFTQGFNKFYISINHKSKIIKSYFSEKNESTKINFIEEKKPLGTSGALSKLKKFKFENLFVTNCDTLLKCNLQNILKFHKDKKNLLTMIVVKKKYRLPYGVCIANKDGNFTTMHEKPSIDYLVNTGVYVINKKALNYISTNKYLDFNELLEKIQKKQKKIMIYRIKEKYWSDVGNWSDYKKTLAVLNLDEK
jgi:dTDP-glucose pyrophosphorylase